MIPVSLFSSRANGMRPGSPWLPGRIPFFVFSQAGSPPPGARPSRIVMVSAESFFPPSTE